MQLREARFLFAAALLHAAFLVSARATHRPERALLARSSGAYREVEVEVPIAPSPPPQEPRTDDRRESEPARERAAPGRRAALPRGAPDDATPAAASPPPEGSATPAPAGLPPDEYGGAPAPDGNRGVAGLGGVPVWQIPGVLGERGPSPRAPTTAPAPRETSADKAGEVLRDALRTRDKSLGLDLPAAGTVASEIAEAVRASETPNVARATFEVRVSGAGEVLGVRVVSSTAGAADVWARVARAAFARLAGRALAMTSAFVKGAKISVTVSSAVRMPAGNPPGGIQPSGAGFGFDISNIGALAVRVVSSSFSVVALD